VYTTKTTADTEWTRRTECYNWARNCLLHRITTQLLESIPTLDAQPDLIGKNPALPSPGAVTAPALAPNPCTDNCTLCRTRVKQHCRMQHISTEILCPHASPGPPPTQDISLPTVPPANMQDAAHNTATASLHRAMHINMVTMHTAKAATAVPYLRSCPGHMTSAQHYLDHL
jgi:hypothetical protein